jgi:hypothetical protein
MQEVLNFLLVFANYVYSIVEWCLNHPDEVFLYSLILNRIYEKLPLSGKGKDLIDAGIDIFGTVYKRKETIASRR